MGVRAIRKKSARKFKVGDVVTWGQRIWAHRVVAVLPDGVRVDATSAGMSDQFFVAFVHPRRASWADLQITDMEPDVPSSLLRRK